MNTSLVDRLQISKFKGTKIFVRPSPLLAVLALITLVVAGTPGVGLAKGKTNKAIAPHNTEEVLQVVTPNNDLKFTLKELKMSLKSDSVTIDDPNYHKKMTFDVFELNDLLSLAGLAKDAPGDEIVFTAKDGYSQNTTFQSFKSHKAYLAFGETGKRSFPKVAQGKALVSPAPYYLIWSEGKALAEQVPWPYQLVKIEVVDFKQKYSKLYPNGEPTTSKVFQGFNTFKSQCIRCHSINLQGGDLGPELNVPMNVTEYWTRENLQKFIRDASTFRLKSKMPPFTHLKNEEIDELLSYLEWMRGRKQMAVR